MWSEIEELWYLYAYLGFSSGNTLYWLFTALVCTKHPEQN